MSGVVTKSDIVAQISQCLGASCTTGVFSVMTRDVACCQQKDWLHDVWSIMKERQLKNVPITDDAARPIGILNARDALQALMQQVEQEERSCGTTSCVSAIADPHSSDAVEAIVDVSGVLRFAAATTLRPAPPARLRYEQYRKQEGGVLNASYRVRLAAIEIDPFVGTEIQAGIIKADLDTTFQAMKP